MCVLNRQIALVDLGFGGGLKDFLGYMEMVSGGATAAKIQELKDLTTRQPIERKRGPTDDKILKLLVYGGQQMPETQIKIGK